MVGKRLIIPRAAHYPRCSHKAYHLSCDDQEDLLARGEHLCYVCLQPPRSVLSLFLDHDHALGWRAVRGLLCASCNSLIRRIDAGQREPDERFRQYIDNPWHRLAGISDLDCPGDCRWGSHKGTTKWRSGR